MSEPLQFRIHIGAHKTATTHFQDSLALQRADLQGEGICYVSRDIVRRQGISYMLRGSGHLRWLSTEKRRKMLTKAFKGVSSGAKRIAISDENLIGSSSDALEAVFYPQLETRLSSLANALAENEVQLFLGIRCQADFLPSAYVQAIRSRPIGEGFDAVRRRILSNPPSWASLVERIQGVTAGLPITVWTHEHYVSNPGSVMARFLASGSVRDLGLSAPMWTQTPTQEAVHAAEQLPVYLPRPVYRARVRKLFLGRFGETHFDPLSDDEKACLNALYLEDKRRIKANGVELLD